MDVESPSSEERAQIEVLSTPQPHHATLPSINELGGRQSPSSSMAVGLPSSFAAGVSHADRTRYTSPPPPSSSMTPPPSSQAPKRVIPDSPIAREETPNASVLSSPPPTVTNGQEREISNGLPHILPSREELRQCSPAELLENALILTDYIRKVEAELAQTRMSAAHYKFQHTLLEIETEEAAKRQAVEHDMTRREMQVLQRAVQSPPEHQAQLSPATSRHIEELRAQCEAIGDENALLQRRLSKAKQIIQQKDDEIEELMKQNRQYIERIRQNREHLNLYRSPGGIYSIGTPRASSGAYPTTPQQYRATPKQTPHSIRHEHDSQDSFAQLLLADRVLNQDNTSAPTTPTTSRQANRRPSHHQRGAQSMSSLPVTPARSRPMTQQGSLLPSVQFAPHTEPRYRTQPEFFVEPIERGRKSRDSTISVEDAEEIAGYGQRSSQMEDREVPESQASFTASQMLRSNARESKEVRGSPVPNTNIVPQTSGVLQAKIFGSMSKPGMDKRKRMEDPIDLATKKSRTGEAGIGLGIGGWA